MATLREKLCFRFHLWEWGCPEGWNLRAGFECYMKEIPSRAARAFRCDFGKVKAVWI